MKGYNKANPFGSNPDITSIHVESNTLEWHQERSKSVGASDVPVILGMTKFDGRSIWHLWQEKVGLVTDPFRMTERMAHGAHMEDVIAKMAEFWHPEEDWWIDYIKYYRGDRTMTPRRTFYRHKAVVRNSNYPWLAASLDRVAPPGQYMADFRTKSEEMFLLEIKNIDGNVARHYEDGIPAYYHSQAQTQMMITGLSYYEFCAFLSGNHLVIKGYWPEPQLIREIIERTHDFWYNRVLPARELMAKANAHRNDGDIKAYNEVIAEIYDRYEPEPENTEQYHEYIRERYKYEYDLDKKMDAVMAGDQDLYKIVQHYGVLSAMKGTLEKVKIGVQAQVENVLRENRVKVIEWEEGGKVTWFPNKGSDKPVFRQTVVRPKDLDLEMVEAIIREHINSSLLKSDL